MSQPSEKPSTSSAFGQGLEQAAKAALVARVASGEIMTYERGGQIVREFPGGKIVVLARVGEFRSEEHFVVR